MLFQVYGDGSSYQLLGWILVFAALVIMNEIARRSKWGGIACFLVLPAVLSVYFIANCNNDKRKNFKSMRFSEFSPVILKNHKSDTAGCFRRRMALRRLVERIKRAGRYFEHFLYDRLVGNLLLKRQKRYALAGHDLGICPCI